jgi:hypothetical protein
MQKQKADAGIPSLPPCSAAVGDIKKNSRHQYKEEEDSR